MNLLAAKLYDPAVAVSKATSALLAMTAFDTVNLRLAITVPAHGMVLFKLRTTITGATTVPTVFLGVMNGATVIGRVTPQDFPGTMNAATQSCPCQCEFVATGLAPGAMNVDAAYGVEVIVALTNIKYGGPNNATTNDAWGAFCFEAWDPQPQTANSTLAVDANGRVDVSKVAGTAQTARDLGLQLDATMSSRMATFALPGNFSTLAITGAGAVTAGTVGDKAGYTLTQAFPANFAALAITAGGSVTAGTVSDKTGYALTAAYDPAKTAASSVDYTAARAAKIDNLDVVLSTRLPTAGYTVPPTAAAIRAEIDANSTGLAAIFARTDVTTSSRLPTATYVAPDNASVGAIKAKTDSLSFTVPGKLDVGVYQVNGVTILGNGTTIPFHV